MAQGTKGAGRPPPLPSASASTSVPPSVPTSSRLSTSSPNGPPPTVNKKKQKRRQKQAAKAAEAAAAASSNPRSQSPAALPSYPSVSHAGLAPQNSAPPVLDDEDPYDTDDDHHVHVNTQASHINGHAIAPIQHSGAAKKKSKKKKKAKASAPLDHHHDAFPSAPMFDGRIDDKDRIWNTSNSEERERIKSFWRNLSEPERKALVKIEKEAVLKKMKEQQKHSCSCSRCGRKRTAIEEELEGLYDAYYDELEQYAARLASSSDPERAAELANEQALYQHQSRSHSRPPLPRLMNATEDEDHDLDEDEDDLEYSDGYDDEYSDSDSYPAAPPELFQFGNSLTVKGGILTVADDLLKNDGKKFIEMMEQMAEARLNKEEEAKPGLPYHGHDPNSLDEDYDDEDDDEEYDSQEEMDDEEDEMDSLTENQRMKEGRRMFQIFAARMFEQRVLNAYREAVADERQRKLIAELAEEDQNKVQREAKKARDAQKRKEKKQQQKQAKAEEKARKEAEKKAEEDEAKRLQEQKAEEARRKKEEQRKKKEAEKKAQDLERARKEAEKQKRAQEERERKEESERKAREQKAQQKARDDARRKQKLEQEAREAKERELARKAQADKEREREAKARAERLAQEKAAQEKALAAEKAREKLRQEKAQREVSQAASQAVHAAQLGLKRTTSTPVAIPPTLQRSNPSFPSPHVQVATPAMPKAPTPRVVGDESELGSKGSSPQTPQGAFTGSKSTSPTSMASVQRSKIGVPKPTLSTVTSLPSASPPLAMLTSTGMQNVHPPPGMGFGGFGAPPMNGFPPTHMPQPPMNANVGSLFAQPHLAHQFRQYPAGSVPPNPPGIPGPTGRMDMAPPSANHVPNYPPGFGLVGRDMNVATSQVQHNRQASGSSNYEAPIGQGAHRPAPIQRPSSVKPHEQLGKSGGFDLDDFSSRLGSSALIDDMDDEMGNGPDGRRAKAMAPLGQPGPGMSTFGSAGLFPQQPMLPFGAMASNGGASAWGTPPMGFTSPSAAAASWNQSVGAWPANPRPLPFGSLTNNGIHQSLQPHRLRSEVCTACQTLLNQNQGTREGFCRIGDILRQIESRTGAAVPLQDVLDICETEGTPQNGGGMFTVQEGVPQEHSLVHWDSGMSADGLAKAGVLPPGMERTGTVGEIGSPSLGMSSLATGGAAPGPFPGLGATAGFQ